MIIEQDQCNVRARGPGRRVAPATAGMATPAMTVLSHELTPANAGTTPTNLLAVSRETEGQFVITITIGWELRPRCFANLRPLRLAASLACGTWWSPEKKNMPCAQKKGVLSSENTFGCQQKKDPDLGKHMQCANKMFLVSDNKCRVRKKGFPVSRNMPCAKKRRFPGVKNMPCATKKKVLVSKKIVLRPPKLLRQHWDPHFEIN